jgi:hypothetical protein
VRCFGLEVPPLETNDFALIIFNENESLPNLLADFLALWVFPVDCQCLSDWIMNDLYLGNNILDGPG